MKKLRILCLHGYNGSASTLKYQIRGLASAMAPYADLVFIDAPSLFEGDFGWWHAVQDNRSGESDHAIGFGDKYYKGFARTLDAIVKTFQDQGPFDGVFGFSQGSALTGILAGLRAPDGIATKDKPLIFDFAMMVGGFPSADKKLARLYQNLESYDLPTLHIIGRSDSIVAPKLSRDLAARFPAALILEHSGGHVIADSDAVKAEVVKFLQNRQTSRGSVIAYRRSQDAEQHDSE